MVWYSIVDMGVSYLARSSTYHVERRIVLHVDSGDYEGVGSMKDAEIFDDEEGLRVTLYIDGELYGTVNMAGHSIVYAQDAVFNWETGILKEDNPHIERA